MSVKSSNQIDFNKVDIAKNTFIKVLIPPSADTSFAMRKFIIKKGGMIPPHKNMIEHQQYVLTGKAEVIIGDESYIVEKDCVVFIPASVPHSYRNIGETDFEFLCLIPDKKDSMTLMN